MRKYLPLLAIALIAVTIGVGVALSSSDDNEETTTTPTSSNATPPASESTSPTPSPVTNTPSTDEVEIEDMAFRPANITVKKGTTVTWTNKDSVEHTVTSDNSGGPRSAMLARDESYSFTFNEVGEFSYHCQPHPQMTGKVTVTE